MEFRARSPHHLASSSREVDGRGELSCSVGDWCCKQVAGDSKFGLS